MSVQNRLKDLLSLGGWGCQAKLADFLGVPPNYVSRWAKDKDYSVPREYLAKMALFFNVSIDFLLTGKEEKQAIARKIPLIGSSSCGVPVGYYSDSAEYIVIPDTIGGDEAYAIIADGNSMLPKINNGDTIICNPNAKVENGDIVHYTIDGESGIKKIKINGTSIALIPLNPLFNAISYNQDDNISILLAKCTNVIGRL